MISLILAALIFQGAHAKIVWQAGEYKPGETVMQGCIAYDDKSTGKRPCLVVVHDWMGMSPFVKGRLMELATMGYTVFAADIYGKGLRPMDANAEVDRKSKIAMTEFFAETLKKIGRGQNEI